MLLPIFLNQRATQLGGYPILHGVSQEIPLGNSVTQFGSLGLTTHSGKISQQVNLKPNMLQLTDAPQCRRISAIRLKLAMTDRFRVLDELFGGSY